MKFVPNHRFYTAPVSISEAIASECRPPHRGDSNLSADLNDTIRMMGRLVTVLAELGLLNSDHVLEVLGSGWKLAPFVSSAVLPDAPP